MAKVGPELRQAIEQDGPERGRVAKKNKKNMQISSIRMKKQEIILENLKLDFSDELGIN